MGEVVNRAQVGWVFCPICDQRATVHRSKIGRGGKASSLYWRGCGCACVQPRGPSGQAFIERNMKGMEVLEQDPESVSQSEPQSEQKGADAIPESQPKSGGRGFFKLLTGDSE